MNHDNAFVSLEASCNDSSTSLMLSPLSISESQYPAPASFFMVGGFITYAFPATTTVLKSMPSIALFTIFAAFFFIS